jgi:hypothetical protein
MHTNHVWGRDKGALGRRRRDARNSVGLQHRVRRNLILPGVGAALERRAPNRVGRAAVLVCAPIFLVCVVRIHTDRKRCDWIRPLPCWAPRRSRTAILIAKIGEERTGPSHKMQDFVDGGVQVFVTVANDGLHCVVLWTHLNVDKGVGVRDWG